MTAAAFKATYSDFRLVKTRGVGQFIFEVPLEPKAVFDHALEVVGGMPQFGSEQWFAIARLNPAGQGAAMQSEARSGKARLGEAGQGLARQDGSTTTEEREPAQVSNPPGRVRKSWDELPITSQIAIRCNEVRFQKFLQEEYFGIWKLTDFREPDEERAAETVRFKCRVGSRKDIKPGTEALEIWGRLEEDYQGWLTI